MPRVFLPPERLTADTAVVEGEQHRYLTRVLRLETGDALVVFDGRGQEIDARVAATAARATTLALGERRAVSLPSLAVTLVQAVPRGERMDFVVQKTTELGITRIVPAVTARSVVQPGAEGRWRRWCTIAQEASRQCGRADIPAVDEPCALAQALADARLGDSKRLLVWEAAEGRSLRFALDGRERAVTLLIGPEGGFTQAEVEEARAAGFEAVGLGPRILRSETAAIVAVALVQAAAGGLD